MHDTVELGGWATHVCTLLSLSMSSWSWLAVEAAAVLTRTKDWRLELRRSNWSEITTKRTLQERGA